MWWGQRLRQLIDGARGRREGGLGVVRTTGCACTAHGLLLPAETAVWACVVVLGGEAATHRVLHGRRLLESFHLAREVVRRLGKVVLAFHRVRVVSVCEVHPHGIWLICMHMLMLTQGRGDQRHAVWCR